ENHLCKSGDAGGKTRREGLLGRGPTTGRRGRAPPRRCHAEKSATQNPRRLPGLRLKPRENLVKAHLVIGTAGMLPRCGRSAQGARWGDPTNTDATPRSAWRWQASSMTPKL